MRATATFSPTIKIAGSAALICAMIQGCAQEPHATLTLSLPANPAAAEARAAQLSASARIDSDLAQEAPATVPEFACIMINVMGPGIGDWTTYQSDAQSSSGYGYFGLYSGMISLANGGTLTLSVPTGSGRIISVIGVRTALSCPTTVSASDLNDLTKYPGVFELARVTQDITGDTSLTMPSSYSVTSALDFRHYLGSALSGADTSAPLVGGSITATPSSTSVALSWPAATDNGTSAVNLEYKVVRASASADIDTVAEADAATTVMDWTANTLTTTAAGLTASTSYAFAVLVRDAGSNKALYTPISATTTSSGGGGGGGGSDTTAPTAGTGISFSGVTSGGMNVLWGSATDDVTSTVALQYKLVKAATSAAIDTVAEADAISGADLVMNWTTAANSDAVTGLSSSTTYFFAVLVRDAAGNKALYSPQSQATAGDTTPPTVGSIITFSSVASYSLTASWGAATDDVTAQGSLQYKLVRDVSSTPIDTVVEADAITGANLIMDWTAGVTTYNVTGLPPSTTNYFAVVVKDAAGNKSIYAPKYAITGADTIAPTAGTGITFSSVSTTSMTLNWGAASDNFTPTANLSYKVVKATTSTAIDTIAKVQAITAPNILVNYSTNTLTVNATALSSSTTYYFAVLVKDSASNYALYPVASQATTTPPDTIAPTLNGGINVISTPTTAAISWTKSTDNQTATGSLQYEVVLASTSAAIDTTAEADAISGADNLTSGYSTDINSISASGLTANTNYYVTVVVKDGAGNKAIYTPMPFSTVVTGSLEKRLHVGDFPNAETSMTPISQDAVRGGFFAGSGATYSYYSLMTGSSNYRYLLKIDPLTGAVDTTYGIKGFLKLATVTGYPSAVTASAFPYLINCGGKLYAQFSTSTLGQFAIYRIDNIATSPAFTASLGSIDTTGGGAITSGGIVMSMTCASGNILTTYDNNSSPYGIWLSRHETGTDLWTAGARIADGNNYQDGFYDSLGAIHLFYQGASNQFWTMNGTDLSKTSATSNGSGNTGVYLETEALTFSDTDMVVWQRFGTAVKIWANTADNLLTGFAAASAYAANVTYTTTQAGGSLQGVRLCRAGGKYLVNLYTYNSGSYPFGTTVLSGGTRWSGYNGGAELTSSATYYNQYYHRGNLNIDCDDAQGVGEFTSLSAANKTTISFIDMSQP